MTLALAGCGQAAPASAPTGAPAAPTAGSAPPTSAPTATDQPTQAPALEATQPAAPSAAPSPSQGGGTSAAPPELVSAAQLQLALHLKVSPAELSLQSADAREWPDGSLGCPAEGMVYPQVVTPGFLLTFADAAQSVQYEVHTAESAAQMVLCQDGQPSELSAKPAAAPDQAGAPMAELARAALAVELGLPPADITVVAVEANEWRDSSLGCPKPGMNYLQVITPGYKVTLEAQGQRYVYHTDSNQRVVRCDPA
jgi:hypothetical protein